MAEPSAVQVTELYRRYGPVIYQRCVTLLRDREAARDATQEVFVKLHRDIAKLQDRASAFPWIYRTATHHCLNMLRDNRLVPTGDAAVFEMAGAPGADTLGEKQLSARVLSRFDETTQAIAVGVLVDGMEHEEVALALDISSRTVSRRLQRFLENARKYLERSEA